MALESSVENLKEITLSVDLRVYSIEALKNTGYALGRNLVTKIEMADATQARVTLIPLNGELEVKTLVGRFWLELLDQDLRESVGRETAPIRNLIMAHALSRVSLLNPELETGEPNVEGK
jgi:His-Xaa-Ser system protein HxsD